MECKKVVVCVAYLDMDSTPKLSSYYVASYIYLAVSEGWTSVAYLTHDAED